MLLHLPCRSIPPACVADHPTAKSYKAKCSSNFSVFFICHAACISFSHPIFPFGHGLCLELGDQGPGSLFYLATNQGMTGIITRRALWPSETLRIAWDIITVLRYVALRCYPKCQRKGAELRSCTTSVQRRLGD